MDNPSPPLAGTTAQNDRVAVSREQLRSFVEELHGWLQQEHGLDLDKKVICVAVSASNLSHSFEDKDAAKAIVLQRAHQKFFALAQAPSKTDELNEALIKTGGRLPWDVLPTGNVDNDEANRAAAIEVISQYCSDFQEPLGVALWQACVGRDTLAGVKKKKQKKNKEMRYEAYRKVAKELGYGERTPLGIFELIIKTRWPEERVEDYIGYIPRGADGGQDVQIIESPLD